MSSTSVSGSKLTHRELQQRRRLLQRRPLSGACAPSGFESNENPSRCIALDYVCGSPTYMLRIAQLTMTKPAALTVGIVSSIVASSVMMNLNQCNLAGNGTWSWLLQMDEAAGTLTTGRRPAGQPDPQSGYCMMNEVLQGALVVPATTSAPVQADGSFTAAPIPALMVPIFIDAGGSSAILLPMKQVRFANVKLSRSAAASANTTRRG